MSTVAEIQEAITRLSTPEQRQLARWFEEVLEDAWDAQIEDDAKFGKLDRVFEKLTKDREPSVSLDDFLDDKKLS